MNFSLKNLIKKSKKKEYEIETTNQKLNQIRNQLQNEKSIIHEYVAESFQPVLHSEKMKADLASQEVQKLKKEFQLQLKTAENEFLLLISSTATLQQDIQDETDHQLQETKNKNDSFHRRIIEEQMKQYTDENSELIVIQVEKLEKYNRHLSDISVNFQSTIDVLQKQINEKVLKMSEEIQKNFTTVSGNFKRKLVNFVFILAINA